MRGLSSPVPPAGATPVRCRPRFPSRNRRFPDRCRSPDCACTAFRCRCLLLWQKLFVLPCRRLRNNYILCPTGTPTFADVRRQRRDLIIANASSAPDPTLAPRQRQRRRRYKQSPEPTTIPAEPIPRSQHRQICTYPPRAKGSLDRRSKRLSFPHFFLRRKKCGRRRLAPAGATPARRRGGEAPILPPAGKKTHKKTAGRRSFSCLEPCPWRRARRRQLKRHGLSRLRVPERHACRPQRDGCVCVRRVPVPPVAHQRHPP